jgi:hypothetical protein
MDVEVIEGRDIFQNILIQTSIGLRKKINNINLGFHIYFQQSWYGDNNIIGTNPHYAKFEGISRVTGIRLNTLLNYYNLTHFNAMLFLQPSPQYLNGFLAVVSGTKNLSYKHNMDCKHN